MIFGLETSGIELLFIFDTLHFSNTDYSQIRSSVLYTEDSQTCLSSKAHSSSVDILIP